MKRDEEPESFPYLRTCPFDPPDDYAAFREQPGPVEVPLGPGGSTWLVTRYDQVRSALNHDGLSNDRKAENYPSPIPLSPEFRTGGSLLGMDSPEHGANRKLVAGEFTHHRAQQMRPRIQEIVDEYVDDMLAAGPGADLHAALGIRVTMRVITGMLGITMADVEFMHSRTRVMFGGEYAADQRQEAIRDLDQYFTDIVRHKHAEPGDDLISRVVAKYPEPKDFNALGHLTRLLLNGGHDSTASMISLGVLTLLNHPEQLRLLVEDPSLAPKAVDELLRFLTVTDLTTPRVSKDKVELGGVAIPPGQGVFPSTAAANRDGGFFERPDELDLTRGSRQHLAFGFGRHLCLGAEIARVELETVYTTVFRRIPDIELAVPIEDLTYRQRGLVFGVEKLPVRWQTREAV